MTNLKLAYVQPKIIFGKPEINYAYIKNSVKNKSADIYVLPELFSSGYNFKSKNEVIKYAESTSNSSTISFLQDLSKSKKALFVGGFAEKANNNFYNSAVAVFPNSKVIIYRKIHLFNREKLFFKPGKKLVTFNYKNVKFGMAICFDWFFPELIRSYAFKKIDVILHPANLVLPWCQKAMPIRALENRIYTVTANRIGVENRGRYKYKFTGQSLICNPNGKILKIANKDAPSVGISSIDTALSRNKKLNKFNHILNDAQLI